MEEFGFINASEMAKLSQKLSGSELKVLLFILYYLSSNSKDYYINNEETRKYLASMGFDKTPERLCSVLTNLVSAGILKRETQGVYSVSDRLYLKVEEDKKITLNKIR